MKLHWSVVFFFMPFFARGQIITTYAGGGGSICEGCPATSSAIPDPTGGVFDKFNNYYFTSCLGGDRVRKVSNTGIITTVAGTGVGGYSGDGSNATAAQLSIPGTVHFDEIGNMYIADAGNNRIRKVDVSTGIISTIAGIGMSGYNGEGIPATNAKMDITEIYVGKMGDIYFSDYNSRRVRKINAAGIITTVAGTGIVGSTGDGGQATAAQLNPRGIVIDKNGNLYIADPYANVVRKVNTAGIISTIAGNGLWTYTGADGIPATAAQMQPYHLAIDRYENIYIGDWYNKMVFKVTPSGIFYHVAGNGVAGFGGDGGPATAAALNYPSGVSTDTCGNLYITEPGNKRVRKVTFYSTCAALDMPVTDKIKSISIFPNPAHEELTIANVLTNSTYQICNLVGSIMQTGGLKEGSNAISVKHLPTGVYMLALTDEGGKRTVHKIIKQ